MFDTGSGQISTSTTTLTAATEEEKMTLETSSDDPPPLETNFDELLEFSETPLPQYEDSALATIENLHHSIIIRIPDPQDNNSKKCEDEEPKYAKVQAKRQSSRSKCSHG